MRVLSVLLLTFLTTGVAAPLAAQAVADAPQRVAVIDVQRLLTESNLGKAALEELKALGEAKQAEAVALQDEINDLRQRLTEGRLSLSDEKIAELEKLGEEKVIAFSRFQDDADRELQKARLDAFGEIEEQVIPLIDTIGRELGYSMIFNKFQSGLLFAQDNVDITEIVLQRFNSSGTGG